MNILLGVTGGIAAYKSCDVISGLKAANEHNIKVIMTENAQKFITPFTLEVLSKNRVYTDEEFWKNGYEINHIELAEWADCFVIYPITVNTISKIANGIADNLLTTTFVAYEGMKLSKIVLFPAANTNMFLNYHIQTNIHKIIGICTLVFGPIDGKLACGQVGKGKVVKPRNAIDIINIVLDNNYYWEYNPKLQTYCEEKNISFTYKLPMFFSV